MSAPAPPWNSPGNTRVGAKHEKVVATQPVEANCVDLRITNPLDDSVDETCHDKVLIANFIHRRVVAATSAVQVQNAVDDLVAAPGLALGQQRVAFISGQLQNGHLRDVAMQVPRNNAQILRREVGLQAKETGSLLDGNVGHFDAEIPQLDAVHSDGVTNPTKQDGGIGQRTAGRDGQPWGQLRRLDQLPLDCRALIVPQQDMKPWRQQVRRRQQLVAIGVPQTPSAVPSLGFDGSVRPAHRAHPGYQPARRR